jgi:hypothetical protein
MEDILSQQLSGILPSFDEKPPFFFLTNSTFFFPRTTLGSSAHHAQLPK